MHEDWMTMREVMAAIGKGERTVYRLIDAKKLRQAHRTMPGRRALPVYHPDDVAQLAAPMIQPQIMPRVNDAAEQAESRRELPPPEFWEALVAALRPIQAQIAAAAETTAETPVMPTVPPLAELRQKVIVTYAEAKALGFTATILRDRRRLPGKRYRLADLEKV